MATYLNNSKFGDQHHEIHVNPGDLIVGILVIVVSIVLHVAVICAAIGANNIVFTRIIVKI